MELAFVLPLLFLLVFGIIEFGFVFNRQITLNHAAREGVRVFSLATRTAADGKTAAEASAPNLIGQVTCTGSGPDVLTKQVTMVCTTTHQKIFGLLPIPSTFNLSSTARMRKE